MTSPPQRVAPVQQRSKCSEYDDYLKKLWEGGCHNAAELYRRLLPLGFKGCATTVRKYVEPWQESLNNPKIKYLHLRRWGNFQQPSLRRLAIWLSSPVKTVSRQDQRKLDQLKITLPDLGEVVRKVSQLVLIIKNRRGDFIDYWLDQAGISSVSALKDFARRLREDKDSIKNGVELEWSNGQTEGQVNRLKKIKRDMYGRGCFDLLRIRVLSGN